MSYHEALPAIGAVILSYFLWLLYCGFSRPSKYPPGPRWLPIVGNTLYLRKLSKILNGQHHALTYLGKLYKTNVLGLKLGREYYVVVFTERLIKQILIKDEFSARPDNYFTRLRSMGTRKGITMTDGHLWEEQRAFAVRHLRELGFGKTLMETLILDELREVIHRLKHGGEIAWSEILAPSVLNVLWAISAGSRFMHNDPKLHHLLHLMEKRSKALDMSGGLQSQIPWLRHIAPDFTGFNVVNKINTQMSEILMDSIQKHKETLKPDTTRDFIDAFLQQMNENDKSDSTFNEEQLVMVCLDFFIAGSETSSNTLNFALLTLLLHPDVQERVHEEIDSVLDNGKFPTVSDRSRYPYTEAVLLESQRFIYVAPVSAPRRVLKNIIFDGYVIPEGTTVLYNLHHMHHDSSIWDKPDEFRPERFLDKEGNFQAEQLYFFGYGKRRCIGETLARTFIFLFFVGLLKHFNLSPVPGQELPKLEAKHGITLSPKPYKMVLTARK